MKRIIVNNVSKAFDVGIKKRQSAIEKIVASVSGKESRKKLQVLDEISFSARSGEIVGIVGPNGSGKTTLLRLIAGIYTPDSGDIYVKGNTISLIGLFIGLQERLTLKDNVFLCCSLFNLSNEEVGRKYDAILKFCELGRFENTKVYQFSQGMKHRLAFSIAIHCNPEVLLLDEVFEVGDEHFRKKSVKEIKKLTKKGATTIIVSHEYDKIKKHCHKIKFLQKGRFVH